MLYIDPQVPAHMADIIKDGYNKVNALWPINHAVNFILNRGVRRNGCCRKLGKTYYAISINKALAHDDDIREVVVHELLHSYPDVFSDGHTGEWARRAQIVNKKYGLHVQRLNHYDHTEIHPPKYVVECSSCHHRWDYYRTPVWINNINRAGCPYCKTHTIVLLSSNVKEKGNT